MINYEKVDELIASHKERLQYHREFLDGSQAEKYNSPKLDIDLSVWGIRGNKDGQHKSHHYSNLPNLRSKSREGNEDFDPHRYLDLSSITKPSRARDVQLVNATSPREVGKKESLRYFTNSHNRMYERGAAWQHYKEENLNRLFEAITSEEMSECSFQPATKTQQYEEELHYSSYLSQQNQNTNGNLSGYINVGEANFIERQRIARERKEQAERRLVPDISKWKNRQTVPMEFEIGKRTGVIPALKKPCFTSGTSPATTKDTVDNVIDVSSIEKIEMKKRKKKVINSRTYQSGGRRNSK